MIEQGFHKTTMADVIRESGLSAGAVYSYFKSKDELIGAIADVALSNVDEVFKKILASPDPVTPVTALRTALEFIVEQAAAPGGDVTRVGVQAWAEALQNDAVMATASEKYALLRGHFADVARRAQADGTIDAAADPDEVAQVLFGLIPGFILQRLILGDVTPDSYSAGLAAILPQPPERGTSRTEEQ